MHETLDNEIVAINAMIKSLEGLDNTAKQRVLNYVAERMGVNIIINNTNLSSGEDAHLLSPTIPTIPVSTHTNTSVDIRTLKDQKQPKTAIQMAVLVAYYLQDLSPAKKETITAEDLTTYFKQANFPLPKGEIRFTLVNAKNAGYFESAGDGQFKLNPVGYNLAVHQLPGSNGKIENNKSKKSKTKNKKTSRK